MKILFLPVKKFGWGVELKNDKNFIWADKILKYKFQKIELMLEHCQKVFKAKKNIVFCQIFSFVMLLL